jgi:ABC-type Fe3+ transport system substrate-binding protein
VNARTVGGLALVIAAVLAIPAARAAPVASVVAAANAEGAVVWYTTTEQKLLEPLLARFAARYPAIKVQPLIVGQAALAPRVTTEQLGGKFTVDLLSNDDLTIEQLVDAGATQPYRISEAERFAKGTIDPKFAWTTLYVNTMVIAWNTERLKADKLVPPASLADLTKPEWRGHLAVDGADFPWYVGTLATQPDAADLLAKLAAQHPLITNGHTFTLTQLEAGEFDATPSAYGYLVEKERLAGRPVDFVRTRPALLALSIIALAKNAPHPNAARVFLEWLLSKEGQQVFQEIGLRTSARVDMPVNRRIFDPKQPYAIERPPERSKYAALQSQFKTLFGIGY